LCLSTKQYAEICSQQGTQKLLTFQPYLRRFKQYVHASQLYFPALCLII